MTGGGSRTYRIRVQKVLRTPVPPLEYNTGTGVALKRMDRDKVAWLPVVEEGRIVGPVSRYGILAHLAASPSEASSMPVGRLISDSAACARFQDTVSSSAAKGNGRDIMHVLLTDSRNRLVAISVIGRPGSFRRPSGRAHLSR